MALLTPQNVVSTGTTPTSITPAASDTINVATAGPAGWLLRVITTGTASNVSVADPNLTAVGNAGTVVPLAAPATGVRMVFIPKAAASPSTSLVTITSSSQAGMTYELYAA